MKKLALIFLLPIPALAATWASNGSLSDVNAKITSASAGDTVTVPSGTYSWGTGGTYVNLNKAITLQGAGSGATTINSTSDVSSGGVVGISAAAVLTGFTFNKSSSGTNNIINIGTANGWRVTNCALNDSSAVGYLIYVTSYGLVDHCVLTGSSGNHALIFHRMSSASWTTADTMGTANCMFVEDCTFNGSALQALEQDGGGRAVFRFNTLNGSQNFDSHMIHTAQTTDGVHASGRHFEVYDNNWASDSAYWDCMDIYGGTGFIFDNTAVNTPWFGLTEYGAYLNLNYFGYGYDTPNRYPYLEQPGQGKDGTQPMYIWHNIQNTGGRGPYSGQNGNFPAGPGPGIPSAAETQYQTETGNPSASYTMSDLIKPDRDYFDYVSSGFNGSTGIGRGTKAQMNAITPSKTGVGFWVTDEGSWNTKLAANTSGQLYVRNGSAWVLKYTPYTYPHPLQSSSGRGGGSAPVISSALTATSSVGSAFSYSIAASNSPTGFSASPLPAGLSVNTSTGVISGTPTAAGNTNVTIGATNATGTGTATLALTVSLVPPNDATTQISIH
jgi:hypothetical protein